VGVVRWLLRKGALVNVADDGMTALLHACWHRHIPVVRLLFERGADSHHRHTVWGETTLVGASFGGHLEIVRLLLAHPSAKATINRRDMMGTTAYVGGLLQAAVRVVVRALLEGGADPTIARNNGTTPVAIVKQINDLRYPVTAEGRRECVAALEVRYQA
jgi:uncharacterized protein